MKNFHNKANKLSRSNTRITVLEYCEKKYFFNYYTFALKKLNISLRETAQILKKLKSLEMRMGEKTHYLISDYLRLLQRKQANNGNIQKLKEEIKSEMETEFKNSKNKNFSKLDFNNQWGISEHFYGENIDNQLPETIQRVHKNLDALINSNWIQQLLPHLEQESIYIEDPRNPNFEAMKIETKNIPALKDINIMASPDFWVSYYPNKYFILDRKSWKEPQNQIWITDQIKVYALKLLLKTRQSTELKDLNIEGNEIYLPTIHNYGWKIEQSDINDIINKIEQDTKFQKQFLINQDPILNQPLASNFFSRTNNSKKCETCTFRKVCNQLKEFE